MSSVSNTSATTSWNTAARHIIANKHLRHSWVVRSLNAENVCLLRVILLQDSKGGIECSLHLPSSTIFGELCVLLFNFSNFSKFFGGWQLFYILNVFVDSSKSALKLLVVAIFCVRVRLSTFGFSLFELCCLHKFLQWKWPMFNQHESIDWWPLTVLSYIHYSLSKVGRECQWYGPDILNRM